MQVTGTTYVLPADPVRRGSTFAGWWTEAAGGARVTAVTQVALMRPHTFYAHWAYNRYSVVFDANGGEGEMDAQGLTVATGATLSECGFMRVGYAFAGWATEPDGEVVYTNAAEVLNLAYEQGASVTLYAVWAAREWTLADYVDCGNLEFSNDAAAVWTPDSTTYKTGGASLRNGVIDAAAEGGRTNTTLTATVVGAGSGSFWWKVNCEEMDDEYDEWYDYAVFMIDGVEIAKIAGDSGWRQVEYAVTGAGPHVLAWTFSRDDYDDDGATWQDCAWVDGVVWTPTPVTVTFAAGGATVGTVPEAVTKYEGYELTLPGAGTLVNSPYVFMGWSDGETTYASGMMYVFGSTNVTLTAVWGEKVWTLGEAVDAGMLSFTTGGDADWSVDGSTGWTNGVSAKSGTVTSGQSSWIEVTVNSAGTLSFRWNVIGGIYRNTPFAYAKMEVDGAQQAQEYRTDGWKEQTATVEGAGAHTIRWTYSRTSSRTADGDCAWLDAVAWTPSADAGLTAWLAERNLTADARAANGRTAAECYALGLDPAEATNDFRIVSIELVDGKPKVEWEPKTNRWTGAEIRAVLKGAERLEGPWTDVLAGGSPGTARPTTRFFKAVVFGDEHDMVQLWENGPYWATTNIGAEDPWEYGYYFWWGDTVGYTNTGKGWISVKGGTKIQFSPSGTAGSTGYKGNSALLEAGYIDETGNLAAAYDAATAHLGSPWRMPTQAEFSALISNCTTTWITTNGVPGLLVTGMGEFANRSIFLPATGDGYDSSLYYNGLKGVYWSSTPNPDYSSCAWYLDFNEHEFGQGFNNYFRYYGRPVRPVRGFTQ